MIQEPHVTITLSMKQAEALLYAAEIGAKRIAEAGLPGGHKARNGAIRILTAHIDDRRKLIQDRIRMVRRE